MSDRMSGPIALVTRFPVWKCRECGDPIAQGERVWWQRGEGSAHLTCGWTLASGTVHLPTKRYIRDVNRQQSLFGEENSDACAAGATCGGANSGLPGWGTRKE